MKRILVKTIVYRLLMIVVTWIIMLFFTGEAQQATAITVISEVSSFIAYYIFERVWRRYEKSS